MNHQFRAGPSGGERISDAVGVGSEEYDETLKMLVPKELRMRAQKSVADMLHNPGSMKSPLKKSVMARGEENEDEGDDDGMTEEERHMEKPRLGPLDKNDAMISKEPRDAAKQQRKIFDGLTIYINGSTHPHISDHALKHLLAENGANMSLHLGRRQVTHVILGKPAGPRSGAGGGLAGGKLQKEIRRVRGCGVKYVGVEWYVSSSCLGRAHTPRVPDTVLNFTITKPGCWKALRQASDFPKLDSRISKSPLGASRASSVPSRRPNREDGKLQLTNWKPTASSRGYA